MILVGSISHALTWVLVELLLKHARAIVRARARAKARVKVDRHPA